MAWYRCALAPRFDALCARARHAYSRVPHAGQGCHTGGGAARAERVEPAAPAPRFDALCARARHAYSHVPHAERGGRTDGRRAQSASNLAALPRASLPH